MGRVGGKNAALPLSLMSASAKACPHYLAMGMTYEQFWDGDVTAHKAFREAEKIRLQRNNQMLWLQGAYIYEALLDVTPYLKAFSKGRPKPYAKEPYDLFKEQREEREAREERERYERIKANVAAFAKAQKEKREKESEKQEVDDNAGCVP
jgi:hypothetical protein